MAIKNLNKENILVKVDQNNLISIDPNTIIEDGYIVSREINQEKLVMYANLEADLIPRTTLSTSNENSSLKTIARGTFNLLHNNEGGDLDTSWTNSFFDVKKVDNAENDVFYQSDESGQSFGIKDISVAIKANFIPFVNINFVDVRGKTLFESPKNSPYNAFFHLPWPIFYLTIKGYYGKAIRYRLHMVKFNSSYDDSTGNFNIETSFVGSTYAYMNDIPLNGVLNAPYMFSRETEKSVGFNQQRGVTEKVISKTSKGYQLLKSIYDEMKQKRLIPQDFPVRTVRELGIIAESLDKILEKEIFYEIVNPEVLNSVTNYKKLLNNFQIAVQEWSNRNLTTSIVPKNFGDDTTYYRFDYTKNRDTKLVNLFDKNNGKTGTLEYILESYKTELNKAINTILLAEKKGGFKTPFLQKKLKSIDAYVNTYNSNNQLGEEYVVAFDNLINDIEELKKVFNEQNDKLEATIEERMNIVVKGENGFGFEPTIRNLFAVLTANAEVYLRLLRETHEKAFTAGETRKNSLQSFNDETNGDAIYPWPQVRKKIPGKDKNIIAYPGEPELRNQLGSYDSIVWPEVAFVEDYIRTSSYAVDPLTTNEGGIGKVNYVFSTDEDKISINPVSTIFSTNNYVPYIDKTPSSFLYEIYERAKMLTLLDSFNQNTIEELANNEFTSINNVTKNEIILVDILSKNVKSYSDLLNVLEGFSPIQNLPYLQDGIPTTNYIKNSLTEPFLIEKYDGSISKYSVNDSQYDKLKYNLSNYKSEEYRRNIYPFNSDLYLSYIKKNSPDTLNFSGNNLFETNNNDSLISTPINGDMWVKDNFIINMFLQDLTVNNNDVNILNTPYFHKQLMSEFDNKKPYGKYKGSSYLLLNSLGFKELDDYIDDKKSIRMSSMFKEVSSTHYVPYLLILKWGSIYHRYKNYKINVVDILRGFKDNRDTTIIDGLRFYNDTEIIPYENIMINNSYISNYELNYSNNKDVGVHPFYDAVYNQIINGYNHIDIETPASSYEQRVTNGTIITNKNTSSNELNYWTTVVDNSKFNANDKRYSIIPSNGYNTFNNNDNVFDFEEQNNYRVIWKNENITDSFSGVTFASHSEYVRDINSKFSISNDYKKIVDLIGTFSPDILNYFENIFLEFSSEQLNVEIESNFFDNVLFNRFQKLLKEISSVDKEKINKIVNSDDIDAILKTIKTEQINNLEILTNQLLTNNNLVKLTMGNPKEISSYIFEGFSGLLQDTSLSFEDYSALDLTTDNLNLLDLYLGEFPDGGTNFYMEFFEVNNIKINEENIVLLRPLILIYSGYRKNNGTPSATDFKEYIRTRIFTYTISGNPDSRISGANNRLALFLDKLISKFSTLQVSDTTLQSIQFSDGYNLRNIKVELYNNFKSFNDRWVSGNSMGQRLLLEEFLFLNKANADIGNTAYLNITKFKDLTNPSNSNLSLYGAISHLIKDTGFDMRPLPAYVNFYGTELKSKNRVKTSSSIADTLFGTFLDVDYEESEPKIIIQLVSNTSNHLDNPESQFKDDSFNITDTHDNPLLITGAEAFNRELLEKSNKVVAFEVSFGDQNQGIFKSVKLDQSTLRNTTESYHVLEELGRSESGASAHSVDVSLYDYYRLASYSCEVTAMGNVMIQPTMFFYIKNIPLFRGTYWITDVSHEISNNNIQTKFKGTRLPRTSLPDIEDSFSANYRPLFEKILSRAIALTNSENVDNTEITIYTEYGNFSTIMSEKQVSGEEIINEAGITPFGMSYNGANDEKHIQMVKYNNEVWLRSNALRMGGETYVIDDATDMSIIGSFINEDIEVSEIKWSQVKQISSISNFYSSKFMFSQHTPINNLLNGITEFYNPIKNIKETVNHSYNLSSTPISFSGPINRGPKNLNSGIGLSNRLMKTLGLQDGDVIYFRIK